MFHLFRHRIHESIALSAFLAVSFTLQIGWIANWLVHRSPWVAEQFTLSDQLGPVSGLYLKSFVSFILLFGVCVLAFRGRDIAHWRDRVFWFFIASVLMFLVLTLPFVYEFQVTVG